MKQIVSLVKDDRVQYALVNDEDGSLIPFADLLLPEPERFGLHEAALLGTNLIAALGLNGHALGPTSPVAVRNEPAALPAAPPARETATERRNRKAREAYHRHKTEHPEGRGIPKDRKKSQTKRYVSLDEVVATVAQYPDGIRMRDVAERIWRTTDGRGTDDPMPGWFYTAVSNRLVKADHDLRERGIPMPVRTEVRPVPDKDGTHHGNTGKFLLPL